MRVLTGIEYAEQLEGRKLCPVVLVGPGNWV